MVRINTDKGRIVVLVVVILLLALGGVELSRIVSARMLRADAQSTSSTWADTLVVGFNDIAAIVAGAAPSEATKLHLEESSRVGDVYRFRIWNKTGQLVFVSERMASSRAPKTISERYGQRIADSIFSGMKYTEAGAGEAPEDPSYFGVSYVPILKDGSVIGVFEVYLDQTADKALYERSFLSTECIIALAVLLAGGIPAFMVYRKMIAHRSAQAETLFLAEHDSLTGIANRMRLGEVAKSALAWTRRNKSCVAVKGAKTLLDAPFALYRDLRIGSVNRSDHSYASRGSRQL
jgi:predicted signal transduction protein with EAL and GGDEF domain